MTRRLIKQFFLCAIAALVVTTPTLVFAGDGFVNLVGIPGLQSGAEPNMQEYVNALLRIAIIAAALIAVIKLILAGAKYILSDLVTTKEDAKRDVFGAIIGLLIILSAVVILRTINPDIVNLPTLVTPPRPDISHVVPGDTPEEERRIAEICAEETGGCEVVSCEMVNTAEGWHYWFGDIGWLASAIPTVAGYDYLVNSVSCGVWCSWHQGEQTGSLIDSGNCYYPNNPTAVEAAREAARQALIDAAEDDLINGDGFLTPIDPNASGTDPLEAMPYFDGGLESDFFRTNNIEATDIKQYFELTIQQQFELDQSEHAAVWQEAIQQSCESAGGSTVRNYGTGGSPRRYYCY